MRAYIMINVDIDKRSAVEQIRDVEGVEKADVVFGPIDILTQVQVRDLDQLTDLVAEIATIEGVNNTVTLIAV